MPFYLIFLGGGCFTEERPVKYHTKFMKKAEEPALGIPTSQAPLVCTPVKKLSVIEQLNTSFDSEDDFVSIPRARRKRRLAVVSDDESSRDSLACSPLRRPTLSTVNQEAEDSQGSQESINVEVIIVIFMHVTNLC